MAKGKGFDRLRLAVATVGSVAASLFGGMSRSARAADQPTPITVVAANASWTSIANDATFAGFVNCSGGSRIGRHPKGKGGGGCLAVSEGSLLGPPARTDGIDDAFAVALNGTGFINPDGTLDVTGTTVTSDNVVIAGLTTRVQYYFSPTQPVMRAVFSFTNPGQAPISATVKVASNAGSDQATNIRATSDGDTVVETADRWILSSDPNPDSGDPTLLFVRAGTGAPVPVTSSDGVYGPGNDDLIDNYAITVPAGTTRSIMVFLRLGTSVADNQGAAAQFDNLATLQSAGLLAGLSPQQQSELLNWAPAGTGGGTSFVANVPSLGDLSRLLLVLTLAGVGVAAVRRGRRDGVA